MIAIARSLLWELTVRHGSFMLGTFAIANALPLFVIGALSGLNVDLNSPELVILPLSLVPYTICIVTIAVIAGQGPLRRFYLSPVSNLSLTLVFFVSGALMALVGVWLSMLSWRMFFPIDWPIFRPAILAVALWAAMHPSLRVSVARPSRIIELIGVVIFSWFWALRFQLHNQTSISDARLGTLSLIDILLVVICLVAGFGLSLYRVGAERCGKHESLFVGFAKKLSGYWDQRGLSSLRSFGPQRAFAWYQWSMRGQPMFFCVFIILLIVVVVQSGSTILAGQSVAASIMRLRQSLAPSLLLLVGLAGLVGFLTSLIDDQSVSTLEDGERIEMERRSALGEFHATLPMTDSQISNAVQLSIAKSVACVIALLAGVALLLVVLDNWLGNPQTDPEQLGAGKLLVLLAIVAIGSWAAMANGAIVGYALINRRWRAIPFLVLICLMVVGQAYARVTVFSIAIGLAVTACWMFVSSFRSNLISLKTVLLSVIVAVVMFVAGFSAWVSFNAGWYVPLWTVILAASSLLPVAVMPRLIAKNRHC